MKRRHPFVRAGAAGFTLIELIAAIAITGIMASMIAPHVGAFQERARSLVCSNNLRQIGIGVLAYAGDHDNEYPVIEPDPQNPVYPNDSTDEIVAKPMLEVLGPYGVDQSVLKCPSDIRGPNWHAKEDPHTSYQWRVMLDGENAAAPKIYGGRRGYGVRIVKPSRVTICTDFEGVHFGRMNRLYADGHVFTVKN